MHPPPLDSVPLEERSRRVWRYIDTTPGLSTPQRWAALSFAIWGEDAAAVGAMWREARGDRRLAFRLRCAMEQAGADFRAGKVAA